MFPVFYQRSREMFHELASLPIARYFLEPLEEHHADSRLHCHRVGLLSLDLAHSLGLPEEQAYAAGLMGLLHDVGKRGVAYCLLEKDGKLTEEEWQSMKAHARIGFLELKKAAEHHEPLYRIPFLVCKGQVAHHEHQKNPYPRSGRDRRKTPRPAAERRRFDVLAHGLSQLLAAADIYDALSSRRAYKEPFPLEKIREILHEEYTGSPVYRNEVLRRGDANLTAGITENTGRFLKVN